MDEYYNMFAELWNYLKVWHKECLTDNEATWDRLLNEADAIAKDGSEFKVAVLSAILQELDRKYKAWKEG